MQVKYIILISAVALFTGSCTKKDIVVENTIITPDLSNPIMQKISNQTWYRNPAVLSQEAENDLKYIWETKVNVPSPSESMATLLYGLAFQNLTLNRNGTSNMLFIPPFFPNAYFHLQGTWQVAKTDENAIILNTKTPVSNNTAKIKVLDLEAKDQTTTLQVSMDFGNRLLDFRFFNNTFHTDPVKREAEDYRWIEKQVVSTTPLKATDFVGAWASANYDGSVSLPEPKEKEVIRATHIEDLLLATPTLLSGQAFDLRADGTASIAYKVFENTFGSDFKKALPEGKTLVSDATWEVKGNKIFIKTDEAFFYSVGEVLFHLPVYGEYLTQVGVVEDLPIRIQKYRYYAIELIEKTDAGFWSRITTNDAIFYAYLSKTPFDVNNTINIKNAFK